MFGKSRQSKKQISSDLKLPEDTWHHHRECRSMQLRTQRIDSIGLLLASLGRNVA